MNTIKLIAIDMDGTLLDSKKHVPPDFEQWVLNHKNIKVVAASGRQYYTLRDIFPLAKDQLLYSAENGGLVFDHGENIFCDAMNPEDVLECIHLTEALPGVTPILCGVESAYMRHSDKNVEDQGHMFYHHLTFLDSLERCPEMHRIIKIALYIDHHGAEQFIDKIRLSRRVRSTVSGKDWIDVNNRTVNKGTGIQELQKRYEISSEESMAFGDYMNDYAMLQVCGESYAMGNACAEIKAVARHETTSNDEDGVMRILRRLPN